MRLFPPNHEMLTGRGVRTGTGFGWTSHLIPFSGRFSFNSPPVHVFGSVRIFQVISYWTRNVESLLVKSKQRCLWAKVQLPGNWLHQTSFQVTFARAAQLSAGDLTGPLGQQLIVASERTGFCSSAPWRIVPMDQPHDGLWPFRYKKTKKGHFLFIDCFHSISSCLRLNRAKRRDRNWERKLWSPQLSGLLSFSSALVV